MEGQRNLTVSLPESVFDRISQVSELERRSQSDLVREAVLSYLEEQEVPSPSDIAAMERGRAEIARGEFLTVDQLLDELDPPSR